MQHMQLSTRLLRVANQRRYSRTQRRYVDIPSIAILDSVRHREVWRDTMILWVQLIGSISSILGLIVTLYVLYREHIIEDDIVELQHTEEAWHEKENHK